MQCENSKSPHLPCLHGECVGEFDGFFVGRLVRLVGELVGVRVVGARVGDVLGLNVGAAVSHHHIGNIVWSKK